MWHSACLAVESRYKSGTAFIHLAVRFPACRETSVCLQTLEKVEAKGLPLRIDFYFHQLSGEAIAHIVMHMDTKEISQSLQEAMFGNEDARRNAGAALADAGAALYIAEQRYRSAFEEAIQAGWKTHDLAALDLKPKGFSPEPNSAIARKLDEIAASN